MLKNIAHDYFFSTKKRLQIKAQLVFPKKVLTKPLKMNTFCVLLHFVQIKCSKKYSVQERVLNCSTNSY